ncbi:hypothetical protein SAMN05444266_106332 [Chitinophaga jiangningensis]|uniref:Uncharacterized protein n=1 Tax=Chitinophaga jiangningensis TaxID=1419482 RepID=A0A1M7FZY1_9BACT|nr:hypothetical protein [Chitinophaga jiangningensis]SHM09209.1 hypothetical protein SAMN05444266_106332 [Chitinophaga jiangningensis]
MTLADVTIIIKKIAIGFIVFLVPLLVIGGTIWFIYHLFNAHH